jgi:hypothetical protein
VTTVVHDEASDLFFPHKRQPVSASELPDVFGLGQQVQPLDLLAERFDPQPDPYLTDPAGWIEQHEFIWSKQRAIAQSVAEHRYTAVPSAHGPGKSWTAARLVAWWLDVHPAGEAFAVTTAPTWPQVKAILWREIRKAKVARGLKGRITLNAEWYLGGARIGAEEEELVAFGRKPADYDQAAFQGIHARYVLIVIDEACGVPKLLYDAVDSLATNVHARVLAVGNPDDPASHFEKICRPGSGWNVLPISVFDTPAFTGEEVPEGMLELLPSPEWVEERKKRWGESSPTYISKVLGQFPDIGEDTLISPRYIREAQELDRTLESKKDRGQYGVDVARYGSNKTVIYRCKAGRLRLEWEGAKTSTTETAGQVSSRVERHKGGVPSVVDADGIGGGVVDILHEQQVAGIVPWHGGAEPIDKTRFANRRAEVYWTFKEEMEAGNIDLDPEDDELAAQLGAIKWKLNSKGKILIESKDDMAKRGVASPDRADAAVLAWAPGYRWVPSREGRRRTHKRQRESLAEDLMEREL